MKGTIKNKEGQWYITYTEWVKGLPKNKGDIFTTKHMVNSTLPYHVWNGERSSEFYFCEPDINLGSMGGGTNIEYIVIPVEKERLIEDGMVVEFDNKKLPFFHPEVLEKVFEEVNNTINKNILDKINSDLTLIDDTGFYLKGFSCSEERNFTEGPYTEDEANSSLELYKSSPGGHKYTNLGITKNKQ